MPTPSDAPSGYHEPVLGPQVVRLLLPPDGVSGPFRTVDMTVGGGGHARLMLEATGPEGTLLGLDRDPAALAAAARALAPFGARCTLAHAAFDTLADAARAHGFDVADALLVDLGVSSRQLDDPARGFSFRADGPLDMRMDTENPTTAADLVARLSESELAQLFRAYGEERHARRIARDIVRERAAAPIDTTLRLAEVVSAAYPARERRTARIHPATRVFQALRMRVNDEPGQLAAGLDAAFDLLAPAGRMAVIAFHSLEDRAVKRRFRDLATGCVCPKEVPVCVCGRVPRARLLTRRAVRPDAAEVAANPRARSARLRAIEKLPAVAPGPAARRAA